MPTYEYRCKNCKHEFELFQAMSDAPVKKCPKCKKLSARRLISAGAGIIFKGSGFYATDYKKKSPPQEKNNAPTGAKEDCNRCSHGRNNCPNYKK
ncbi:MAG: zinc ribbon domain-containing protein [Candidatus Omnitrophica bacterium]|nr:zinc ribbon domain-containing protein [Candidatus Omnitrophota bacterium]